MLENNVNPLKKLYLKFFWLKPLILPYFVEITSVSVTCTLSLVEFINGME